MQHLTEMLMFVIPQALWELLKARYPKLITHGCTAHVIDLYLKKLGNIPGIRTQLDRANVIVTYFRLHARANFILGEARLEHGQTSGLVSIALTRFGTWALMLMSLLKNR